MFDPPASDCNFKVVTTRTCYKNDDYTGYLGEVRDLSDSEGRRVFLDVLGSCPDDAHISIEISDAKFEAFNPSSEVVCVDGPTDPGTGGGTGGTGGDTGGDGDGGGTCGGTGVGDGDGNNVDYGRWGGDGGLDGIGDVDGMSKSGKDLKEKLDGWIDKIESNKTVQKIKGHSYIKTQNGWCKIKCVNG